MHKRYLYVLAALCVYPVFAAEVSQGIEITADYRLAAPDTPPRRNSHGWSAVAERYTEFDAVEWQFRVLVEAPDSPLIVERGESADFVAELPSGGPVTLHWSQGSHSRTTDFQPMTQALAVGISTSLESFGGRSSDGAMPYFNLANGQGGLIVAVGWPGDWKAKFVLEAAGRVRVTAGLMWADFSVPPGEALRMPSILLMPYRGGWLDGQNKFRRLMLKHFTPASHPPKALMPVAASVHGMIGFNDTTEENLVKLAADIAALKLPLDTFWLDAGWNTGGFPHGQGNPEPDAARFPRGLAPVGAAARAGGMRFLAWFEPERAMRGTWLEREHADWLLAPSETPAALRYQENDGFRLLDLGNPAARAWAVGSVADTIAAAGIAIYRQDFNLYPSYFWQTGEPTAEQGLREVRYINGLYAYLDALAARFPDLILDNCASGGRRLDFEMMRRCVALWRSDSCWDSKDYPRNVQAMAHGLSLWLPLHGLGAAATDTLALRSGMGACASFAINYRDPAAVAALRAHLEKYLPVRELFTKDFYPLTPWSAEKPAWIAWQYHDPGSGRGVLQAFRGAVAEGDSFQLRPSGLLPDGQYEIRDWDGATAPVIMRGAEFMANGVLLQCGAEAVARVLEYREAR